MPELLLALDVGTTTLRACLFAPNGDLLAQASAPVASASPFPGANEQDGAAIWNDAQAAIARALSSANRSPRDLAAVGVTTQRTSAILWDKATGAPLTPLVVWSDLRGAERAHELRELGFPLAPQQAATKVEAMVASVQGIPAQNTALGNIDSFLIWKLSGGAAHVTDRSQAWPMGYLDMQTFGWNSRLQDAQKLSAEMFPTLCDTWGHLGVTAETVLGARVPICADIADQQSALIGQGCEVKGECKVSFGTSATLDVSTAGAFLYPSATLPPFILSSVGGETRFCLEGMVYSAGAALDWLRVNFALGDHAQFEARAASVSDTLGVHFLPALQGLGAPYGDLAKRALVGGFGFGATAAHVARGAMEGVAFRVKEVVEHAYGAAGYDLPSVVKADGGLTANDTFMQIQADLLALPLARHAHREATASGAAIAAGRGCGLLGEGDAKGFVRHDRVFEPRLSRDEAAARLATWQAQVYGAKA